MQHCLIISRSARALVESACKANYVVHAIDAFADEDMCTMATTHYRCDFKENSFDSAELEQYIDEILTRFPVEICVLGAGMELHANSLAKYTTRFQICVNRLETLNRLIDPFLLSRLCRDHDIAFPAVAKQVCPERGWLIKRVGSHGGEHICWANQNDACSDEFYFQQHHAGDVRSVVFLTDGTQVQIVGFNQQMQYKSDDHPFLYAGAISIHPARTEHDAIKEIVTVLVNKTGLIGLCGMDYIIKEDGQLMVLEINARPPATFELHETDQSLLKAHIETFTKPVVSYDRYPCFRGYAIIYADQDTLISSVIDWPDWVKDRPNKGMMINRGQPICTIHAETDSNEEIQNLLNDRRQIIRKALNSIAN